LAADDPETEPAEEEEKDAPCSPEGVGDQDAPGIVVEGAVVCSEKGGVSVAGERRARGGEGEEEGEGQGSAGEKQGDGWQVLGVPIKGLCKAVSRAAVLAEPGLEAQIEEEAKVGVGGERDKGVRGGRQVDGHNHWPFCASWRAEREKDRTLTDTPSPDKRVGELVQ